MSVLRARVVAGLQRADDNIDIDDEDMFSASSCQHVYQPERAFIQLDIRMFFQPTT